MITTDYEVLGWQVAVGTVLGVIFRLRHDVIRPLAIFVVGELRGSGFGRVSQRWIEYRDAEYEYRDAEYEYCDAEYEYRGALAATDSAGTS